MGSPDIVYSDCDYLYYGGLHVNLVFGGHAGMIARCIYFAFADFGICFLWVNVLFNHWFTR